MCCSIADLSTSRRRRQRQRRPPDWNTITSLWPSGCRKFPSQLLFEHNFGRKSVQAGNSIVIMEAISHLLIHLNFYESIIYDLDLRSCKNEKCPKTRKGRSASGQMSSHALDQPKQWRRVPKRRYKNYEHVAMWSHRHTRRLWMSSRLKEKSTWSGLAVK